MTFIYWLFIITGALGAAYGVNVILKQRVEIFHRQAIRLYQGRAAQLIGLGFLLAGIGATVIGSAGFTPLAIGVGIVCSLSYLGLRTLADQIAEKESAALSLPSQKKKS